MACFHPNYAVYHPLGDRNGKKVHFQGAIKKEDRHLFVDENKGGWKAFGKEVKLEGRGEWLISPEIKRENGILITKMIMLPCGQCTGCRLDRSRQWAMRCMHEASLHKENCFITLTYDDKHLPKDNSLDYRQFQLFMKRLRGTMSRQYGIPNNIRFYMAGEYGEQLGRPHFHACLFNINFHDKTPWQITPSGFRLYRSKILERLWPYGYSTIGDVTFESAAYVARYIMKKALGKSAVEHYGVKMNEEGTACLLNPETMKPIYLRTPEFTKMSLKPGIGHGWYEKYKDEVYPEDYIVVRNKKCKPPKYYDKILEKEDEHMFKILKLKRELESIESSPDDLFRHLSAHEAHAESRLKQLRRPLT